MNGLQVLLVVAAIIVSNIGAYRAGVRDGVEKGIRRTLCAVKEAMPHLEFMRLVRKLGNE